MFFVCQQLSIPRQPTGGCEQNTFPHCMYRHEHSARTSPMMSHAHAWLKAQVVRSMKHISSSCHLSRAMSFDPHSTPSLLFSTLPSSTSSTLSGSCSTSFQPRTCADPHGLGGDGFHGIRNSHRKRERRREGEKEKEGGRERVKKRAL